jgi:hypothetical protein
MLRPAHALPRYLGRRYRQMGFGTGAMRRDIELAVSPILRAAEPGTPEA